MEASRNRLDLYFLDQADLNVKKINLPEHSSAWEVAAEGAKLKRRSRRSGENLFSANIVIYMTVQIFPTCSLCISSNYFKICCISIIIFPSNEHDRCMLDITLLDADFGLVLSMVVIVEPPPVVDSFAAR